MIETWTMANGLRVVAEQLPYLRSVSVGVFVHAGSAMEKPEENGLSHFNEHMAFKGTATRSNRRIAEETDALGGNLNAFTARDQTCFYVKAVEDDLAQAVDLLSDIVLHPAMDPEELERERGVVLEEISMDEDAPEELVSDLLTRAQYGDTAAGRPILGTAALVSAYGREDLLAYRAKHYGPATSVVSVCGSFDRARLEEVLERCFGAWTASAADAPLAPQPPLTGVRLDREKDTEQTHLALGWPGFAYGAKENVGLSVLNTVLGGGMSSRLFQRVREQLGMAYSIYSWTGAGEGTGAIGVYAGVAPKNAGRVLGEIARETGRLRAEGVSRKEFEEARKQLRIGYMLGLESPGARMQAMGHRMLLLNAVRTPEEVLAGIDAITLEQVNALTAAVLAEKPCLAVVGRGAEGVTEVPA